MSRYNSYKRNSRSYRRKRPRKQPSGRAVLIVTEGEKTEPNYLKCLRNRLRLVATDVEIVHPDGTDPLTLVHHAIELRNQRKMDSKSGQNVAYDEVWVVFDLEKTHDRRRQLAKEAKNVKGAQEIQFAVSDPCFEFWLLLHETYTTRQFPDCKVLVSRLKKYIPGYSKGHVLTSDFLEKTPTAVEGSERCREYHKACEGDGNPSTEMDKLVRSLNEATREHFRFKLEPET